VLEVGFDSRAWILGEEIKDTWDQKVKAQWHENRQHLTESLGAEFGSIAFESKLKNFIDFGRIPFSVLSFHNRFVKQIRDTWGNLH